AAPVAATAPVTTPAPQSANEQDGFVLEGELCGASNDALKRFAAYVADRREVAVDCTQLRRLDFVCAGQLFNILATLQAQGKLVGLRNVNAMVAALLRVMSVDQVAHVTLRS
ncbi:STAS domain-containing protein, partial [Thauera sp.]